MHDINFHRVLAGPPVRWTRVAPQIDRIVACQEPLARELHLVEELGERSDVHHLQIGLVRLHANDALIGGDTIDNFIAEVDRAVRPTLIGDLPDANGRDARLASLDRGEERRQVVECRHLVEIEPVFLRQVFAHAWPNGACPGLLVEHAVDLATHPRGVAGLSGHAGKRLWGVLLQHVIHRDEIMTWTSSYSSCSMRYDCKHRTSLG